MFRCLLIAITILSLSNAASANTFPQHRFESEYISILFPQPEVRRTQGTNSFMYSQTVSAAETYRQSDTFTVVVTLRAGQTNVRQDFSHLSQRPDKFLRLVQKELDQNKEKARDQGIRMSVTAQLVTKSPVWCSGYPGYDFQVDGETNYYGHAKISDRYYRREILTPNLSIALTYFRSRSDQWLNFDRRLESSKGEQVASVFFDSLLVNNLKNGQPIAESSPEGTWIVTASNTEDSVLIDEVMRFDADGDVLIGLRLYGSHEGGRLSLNLPKTDRKLEGTLNFEAGYMELRMSDVPVSGTKAANLPDTVRLTLRRRGGPICHSEQAHRLSRTIDKLSKQARQDDLILRADREIAKLQQQIPTTRTEAAVRRLVIESWSHSRQSNIQIITWNLFDQADVELSRSVNPEFAHGLFLAERYFRKFNESLN